MVNASYKGISLGDNNITTEAGITVPGIYEEIENNRKAILLSDITVAGTELRDIFVSPEVSGTNYTFVAHGYTWTVTNEDAVSIVAVA